MSERHFHGQRHGRFNLDQATEVQPERALMLEQIRNILGGEAFNSWYNGVHKLRAAGDHQGYELEISNKLFSLTAAAYEENEQMNAELAREREWLGIDCAGAIVVNGDAELAEAREHRAEQDDARYAGTF